MRTRKDSIVSQEQTPEQYVKGLRTRFWVAVVCFVAIVGTTVGSVGQYFIRTPPYVYLILSQTTDEHESMSDQHADIKNMLVAQDEKIDGLSVRVGNLEQAKDVAQKIHHKPIDEWTCFPQCRHLYQEGLGTP